MSATPAPSVPARDGLLVSLLALIACQIGLHACTQGMRMAAPLQALQVGRGPWAVGVLMSCFALLPALLALRAGRLADRHGYHLPVRLAAAMSLVGAGGAALSGHYIVLCMAAALCGAGSGVGMIAIQRTAGRMARDRTERMRVFSWIALAPSVAGLIGPLLAGEMIDRLGFRAAFGALALLPALTLFVAQAVPRETGRVTPAAGTPGTAPPRPAWDLLRDPSFTRLLFVNWLVSASWDVFGFALPLIGHQRGLSASALGGVMFAYAVASMSVRVLIPFVAHRLSRNAMMVGALAVTAAVFAILPLLDHAPAMSACAALLGLALGAIQPAILSSVHDTSPADRHGEALALRSLTVHVSMAGMPLLFGVVGTALGAGALVWIMAAALGAGCWQVRAPSRAAVPQA